MVSSSTPLCQPMPAPRFPLPAETPVARCSLPLTSTLTDPFEPSFLPAPAETPTDAPKLTVTVTV